MTEVPPPDDEPFWGGHPFFTQFGLDVAAQAFFARHSGIDDVDLSFTSEGVLSLRGERDPDFTPPKDLPAGKIWLAPFGPLSSERRFETYDGADDLAGRIRDLVGTLPPANGRIRSGTIGRAKASIKVPIHHATILIYVEGRTKDPKYQVPYWSARTSVHFDRMDAPLTDIAAAGGKTAYMLKHLLDQPEAARLPRDIAAVPHRAKMPDWIELPLDSFNIDRNDA